jgi:hypothetical protein
MRSDKQKDLLKKLIEDERDPAVLDLVGNLLERRTQGVAFTSDLVERVLRSEEDLKAGRVQSLEEFIRDTDDFIDGLYDESLPLRS